MVTVIDGAVSLVPTTFEWAEDIDAQRAEESLQRAQAVLSGKNVPDTDLVLAKARLRRALVRKGVAAEK